MATFRNVYAPEIDDGFYRCPCCRHPTLSDRGGFAICPVCEWEDDGQDDQDADMVRGGPNGDLSLMQARRRFEAMGYAPHGDLPYRRPPSPEELRDRLGDMPTATLLMPLLNEGTTVWARVLADPQPNGQYRVLGPMPEDQEWQFDPGELVFAELQRFQEGAEALAVVGRGAERE